MTCPVGCFGLEPGETCDHMKKSGGYRDRWERPERSGEFLTKPYRPGGARRVRPPADDEAVLRITDDDPVVLRITDDDPAPSSSRRYAAPKGGTGVNAVLNARYAAEERGRQAGEILRVFHALHRRPPSVAGLRRVYTAWGELLV
jgi:hypothetical protein